MAPITQERTGITDADRRIRDLFASTGHAPKHDIQYALSLRGVSQAQIASDEQVTPTTVSEVIAGTSRSHAVATKIAEVIGVPMRRLWGDTYDYAPRSLRRAA